MGKEQIKVILNVDVTPSGSDLAVCNAARKSFGVRSSWEEEPVWVLDSKGSRLKHVAGKLKERDKSLISFLARGMASKDFESFLQQCPAPDTDGHTQELKEALWLFRNTPTHDTPFNHCFISFEIKAPLFVRSHLVKTEYTIMSEFSRRYITDDVEFYEHDYREVAEDKKQGSGGIHSGADHWKTMVGHKNQEQLDLYNTMIKDGVAPEQARGVLPQDLMTAWTWSGTLGAMAKMCRERLGSDAQQETRYVAEQVYGYLKEYYPVSAKCLVEGC